MKDTLADIRKKLQEGAYQNEEHVRLSLVARILHDLEWNLWDPREVNAEYKPAPTEDRTKVDLALFLDPREPSVFIEVKPVGGIGNLAQVERQLRDYNCDNTALFCVITDGPTWRFYYSRTGGEFDRKRFKVLDLVKQEPEDIEATLRTFLGKDKIRSGQAETEAKALLELSKEDQAMEEYLPEARRRIQAPPYPGLPDALVEVASERGYSTITREKTVRFLGDRDERQESGPGDLDYDRDREGQVPPGPDQILLNPERPDSLRFTRVLEASIGGKTCRSWNDLVRTGVRLAVERGHGIGELREWVKGNIIREGRLTTDGFHPIPGTGLSVVGMEAHRAWENAFILAKKLACKVQVRFRWEVDEGAAHPGRRGILSWTP
ncbi:MAG: hypothetical protein MUP47_10015 [Phycisphaerae bacterium]|nr:hypothetical protein [Phycisphaerae bacterium]